jgi:predicted transcriptional regulator
MTTTPPRRPTDAELDILRILWGIGPSTVRQVHEALSEDPNGRGSGHTTVLKHMQIMVEKGLLVRDEDVRPQVYQPARSEGQTQKQLLQYLLDKAYRGSAASLVMQALSTERATAEERSAIRSLLDRMEPDGSGDGDGEEEPS